MGKPGLSEIIRSSKVVVHGGRYAYLKAKNAELGKHFLVAQDADEITVVTEEENVAGTEYEEDYKWFALIEIQVSQPFIAEGFLATITRAIADQNMSVLVVSTFSKDYILVREEKLEVAVKALEALGFPVEVDRVDRGP